jgi:hypothetical protein
MSVGTSIILVSDFTPITLAILHQCHHVVQAKKKNLICLERSGVRWPAGRGGQRESYCCSWRLVSPAEGATGVRVMW